MNEYQLYLAAASLIDGGWSPEDAEELQEEYSLTDEETEELTKMMKKVLED